MKFNLRSMAAGFVAVTALTSTAQSEIKLDAWNAPIPTLKTYYVDNKPIADSFSVAVLSTEDAPNHTVTLTVRDETKTKVLATKTVTANFIKSVLGPMYNTTMAPYYDPNNRIYFSIDYNRPTQYGSTEYFSITVKNAAGATVLEHVNFYGLTTLQDRYISPIIPAGTEPCEGSPAIGTYCGGGTIYAGIYNSKKYMLMPSGCDRTLTEPTCNQWSHTYGISAYYSSAPATYAKQDCANMVYAGYSDWYLPNKEELNYIYCNTKGQTTNVAGGSTGGTCPGGVRKQLIPVMAGGTYLSMSGTATWFQNFLDGKQTLYTADGRGFTTYMRCVRSVASTASITTKTPAAATPTPTPTPAPTPDQSLNSTFADPTITCGNGNVTIRPNISGPMYIDESVNGGAWAPLSAYVQSPGGFFGKAMACPTTYKLRNNRNTSIVANVAITAATPAPTATPTPTPTPAPTTTNPFTGASAYCGSGELRATVTVSRSTAVQYLIVSGSWVSAGTKSGTFELRFAVSSCPSSMTVRDQSNTSLVRTFTVSPK